MSKPHVLIHTFEVSVEVPYAIKAEAVQNVLDRALDIVDEPLNMIDWNIGHIEYKGSEERGGHKR